MPGATPKPQDAKLLLSTEQIRARSKIQVARIVQEVGKIADGEFTDPQHANTRLAAAKLLLAKALPDLSSVEMTGAAGGPLTITINKL